MGKIIGIDLGTTGSCIAVMEGGKPKIIPNEEGGRITPSAVAISDDSRILTGSAAIARAMICPDASACSIIRKLGTDYKLTYANACLSAMQIAGILLMKLKRDAENYLGEPVTDAVIAVPALFMENQRQELREAGRLAGLKVQRLISAPSAAALAYGIDKENEQKILVFDLGGGSFDVSILEIGDGVFEVLAVGGNMRLGGEDFDQKLMDYSVSEFYKSSGIDLCNDRVAMQRIREAAEKVKIGLSGITETCLYIPYICCGTSGRNNLDMTITRSKFFELTADLLEATAEPVKKAMDDAYVTRNDISDVVFVGGSTRIPAVRDIVVGLIHKEPRRCINPDECVAIGAAIEAGVIGGDISNVLLLDVTPYSIGIETNGGVYTTIIKSNTTIPALKSEVFSTVRDGQTSVDIYMYQGESQKASENLMIKKITLDSIPPAPKGVPQIEVTIDIDANGIVRVSAKDLGTGGNVSSDPVNEKNYPPKQPKEPLLHKTKKMFGKKSSKKP